MYVIRVWGKIFVLRDPESNEIVSIILIVNDKEYTWGYSNVKETVDSMIAYFSKDVIVSNGEGKEMEEVN